MCSGNNLSCLDEIEAKGRIDKAREMSVELYRLGVPLNVIVEASGYNEDTVQQWISDDMSDKQC